MCWARGVQFLLSNCMGVLDILYRGLCHRPELHFEEMRSLFVVLDDMLLAQGMALTLNHWKKTVVPMCKVIKMFI